MTPASLVTWTPERLLTSAAASDSARASKADFPTLLRSEVEMLSKHVGHASELLAAHTAGELVSPHELVMAMEQAKLSIHLAIEIRNRLVDAYQELTRLQV